MSINGATTSNGIKKVRYRAIWLPAVVFSFSLIILLTLLNSSRSLWQNEVDSHTKEHVNYQAALLERNLNRSFSSAYVLGSLVQQQQGKLDYFDYTAKSLLHAFQGISNLQLAPNGIIEKIYPLAGQEKALGHNILKDDKRLKEAILATQSRKMTLAGPFKLVQGGMAIIARQPVFLTDGDPSDAMTPDKGEKFWGFASALIYLDDAINMSELNQLEQLGYDYQLTRIHPDTGIEQAFFGSVDKAKNTIFSQEIKLPNSTWYLYIAKSGVSFSIFWVGALLFICLVLSFLISHWVYIQKNTGFKLKSLVNKRTQELKRETFELKKFYNAVEQSGNAVVITDIDAIIEYVNPRFTEVTGFTSDEAIGKKTNILRSQITTPEEHDELWQAILSGRSWYGERRNRQKCGTLYWSKMSISPVKSSKGTITHFVCVSEDITNAKEEYLNIQHLAFHDPLTSLPNRRFFVDRLEQMIKMTKRSNKYNVLMFVDLDKFKEINDTLGHDIGDLVLIEVAHRLHTCLRATDVVARIGGDEFTVLLPEINSLSEAEDIAKKVLSSVDVEMVISDQKINLTISIGITFLLAEENLSMNQLIRRADIALYRAKEMGRNCYHLYREER